jgi:hypothetical protein
MTGQGKSMTEWWCDQIIQGEWYDELIAAHRAKRTGLDAEDVPLGLRAHLPVGRSRLRLHVLRQWLQRSWMQAGAARAGIRR